MSATIEFNRWMVADGETDALVKQTITDTAAALSIPAGANAVQLTLEKHAESDGSQPIVRTYRHGTAPTATDGEPLTNLETRVIYGLGAIKAHQFISADGRNQTVYCSWFKTH